MKKEEIIGEIISGISDFKIIPFFGSGMSIPCGASDWSGLIEDLRAELATDETNFLIVAQQYEDRFGRSELIDKLKASCQLKNLDSKSLQNHLRILAMNPPIIYTTNYDNAIEEAAGLILRDYKKIVSLQDIVQSPHGANQIIKFHGDFESEKSIVITRKDYDERLKLERHPLDVLFRSHILGKSILFLGYSFRDENIELIFNMHKELYGTESIPKSYIISFEFDEAKELALRERNIITLALSSPSELIELINEISEKVFSKSVSAQLNSMFKSSPSIVLTDFELQHLKQFVKSEHTLQEKHDKIRVTLEGKTISLDVEDHVKDFMEDIIKGDYPDELKEAVVLSFKHVNFRKTKNIAELCFALILLTENPKFLRDFESNMLLDVVSEVEHKFGEMFKDSVKSRWWTSFLIIGYLMAMISERKELSYDQVDRLLDGLRNYRYEEFSDFNGSYPVDEIKEVIEFYLSKHDSSMRARFKRKSFIHTATELSEEITKHLPKNLQ